MRFALWGSILAEPAPPSDLGHARGLWAYARRRALTAHNAAAGESASTRKHFEAAVPLEDTMVYGEPPEWSIPVRQEFGVVLLQMGRAAAAERDIREDLERFPANGWSLHGLAASLRAQGRSREATATRAEFERMWEGKEPPHPGSTLSLRVPLTVLKACGGPPTFETMTGRRFT